jgi:Fur family ferric uptake transcriptional regulator
MKATRSTQSKPRRGGGMSANGKGVTGMSRKAQTEEFWRAYLTKHRLKVSRTREEVVSAFLEMEGHANLEQVHAWVKKRNPSIGLATVYRALKLLEDAGIAQARRFTDRTATYEVTIGREHHDHLICDSCGRIVEFLDEDIERIQQQTAGEHGFVLLRHRHELFGLCQDCRGGGLVA